MRINKERIKKMDVNLLKQDARAKKFSDGNFIVREGEKGDKMYFVIEGKADLYKGETKIKTMSAGKFFGECALFLHRSYSETALASGDVTALEIERTQVFKFIEAHPMLTYLMMKNFCKQIYDPESEAPEETLEEVAPPSAPVAPAPAASAPAPVSALFSDTPPPGFVFDSAPTQLTSELFPEGHQAYTLEPWHTPDALIYKKSYKCPVCEATFQAYTVRTTRLKLKTRDNDFRSHYQDIDTTYYEIVTCAECYFSNFESAYSQPIIARFKENIPQITEFKSKLNMDLINDRSINPVFAGYYLALKGAPLFYKNPEMFIAKIWLRLMWLYRDCEAVEMEEMAAKKAHESYLAAFEKTDATPEAIQQLCVLMGELSLIVKDLPNAKLFFVKARNYRGGSKIMQTQAEEGIETIRKIEAGQIKF
jgi:hypothetical protein